MMVRSLLHHQPTLFFLPRPMNGRLTQARCRPTLCSSPRGAGTLRLQHARRWRPSSMRLKRVARLMGKKKGEVVTNLRHIWRTKILFANILDRANCSCLFTSTTISPQVSPKTLKHSAKLSELFSGRNFFPTIFVLRKI